VVKERWTKVHRDEVKKTCTYMGALQVSLHRLGQGSELLFFDRSSVMFDVQARRMYYKREEYSLLSCTMSSGTAHL